MNHDDENILLNDDETERGDEDILLEDDSSESAESSLQNDLESPWKILVIDDEKDIHLATSFVLKDVHFHNREIELTSAFSASDAIEVLKKENDFAVIILDVVMESTDAGLQLVHFIRKQLKNEFVRIILRTGQPGEAPEESIIIDYDIDDYKLKTELTSSRLKSSIVAALRSYEIIMKLEDYRLNLEQKVQERTAELEQQKNELKSVNEMKDRFFSILAHDLRSPLSGIATLLNMLISKYNEKSQDEILRWLYEMEKNANSVYALLENVLQWAYEQSGKMRFSPDKVDLLEAISEMENLYSNIAKTKDLRITIEVNSETYVHADRFMLDTIHRNLLSNAIKFTEPGGKITIYSRSDANATYVTFKDTGIGMDGETLDLIMNQKEPVRKKGTEGEQSTGLGLLLCREFIKKHDGTFLIESEPRQGSVIKYSLPNAE